jgi:hypothetical protein
LIGHIAVFIDIFARKLSVSIGAVVQLFYPMMLGMNNSSGNAPALRDAGASLTAFPRRSVGTIGWVIYCEQKKWGQVFKFERKNGVRSLNLNAGFRNSSLENIEEKTC